MSVIDEQFEHEEAFPRLTRELLAVIEAAGEERTLAKGEVLNRAGEIAREFYGAGHSRATRTTALRRSG